MALKLLSVFLIASYALYQLELQTQQAVAAAA